MRTFEFRVYKLRTKEALEFYIGEIYPRHLKSFPLFGIRYFNFRPVLRWACHSATSWLCAAYLYSLGNSAVHDDCCRISS